jgi:hypothetical protein
MCAREWRWAERSVRITPVTSSFWVREGTRQISS